MSKDVKGVFVSLPLSEDQLNELYHAVMYLGEEAALRNIGTPVTGCDLEPLAFVNADRLKWKIETNNDVCLTFSGKPHFGGGTLNLIDGIVLHSDALTKLAEKDAEIARLRDVLSLFTAYESLMDDGEDVAAMAAYANLQLKVHEALKGPEA